MYPMLKSKVSPGVFFDDYGNIHFCAENQDGEVIEILRPVYEALLDADGSKPLNLPDNGRGLIPELKHRKLTLTTRFIRGEGIINRYILFNVNSELTNIKWVKEINKALPIVSLMVFVIAILLIILFDPMATTDFNFIVYILLIVLSIVLHETGHFIASISCGQPLKDIGIVLFGVLPIGVYLAFYERKMDSKEKLQFALSGVEMNLLLAGCFFILSAISPSFCLTTAYAADANIILAIINLLPASGLDGEAVLCTILGIEDSIINEAKKHYAEIKSVNNNLITVPKRPMGIIRLLVYSLNMLSDVLIPLFAGLGCICWFLLIIYYLYL